MRDKSFWVKTADLLLEWYERMQRPFPWRYQFNPYGTWVCEVMSQQTQMSRVEAFWTRWMNRFPTLSALASSDEATVLEYWKGLGYYRRARALRSAAQTLVEMGFEQIPSDEKLLSQLPTFGPYTLSAVMAIGFDRPFVPLDGNLRRVLARLTDEPESIQKMTVDQNFKAIVRLMMNDHSPNKVAQAFMDLGSGPCAPKAECSCCPLTGSCLAYERGTVDQRPVKHRQTKVRRRKGVALICVKGSAVGLRQRGSEGLWADFLEVPWLVGEEDEPLEHQIERLAQQLGIESYELTGLCQKMHYTSWNVDLWYYETQQLPSVSLWWRSQVDWQKAMMPQGMSQTLDQWKEKKKKRP